MTFEIAKKIENILQKYGISSVLEFNQGIRTSYYMDMILKATPWELRLGSAKYEDLLDLMNLVIDLKCPMSRCMIGDTPIDDPFRNIFLSGIRHYLKETLGKGKCSNYKYLIEFMNEIDTAGMKVYMVEQLPYLLEERMIVFRKRISQSLFKKRPSSSSIIRKSSWRYICSSLYG